MKAALIAVAALGGVALGGLAHADNRAWTVARDHLPDTALVVSVDVEAVAKTKVWAKVAPLLLEQHDAKEVFARVKASCKLDATTAVTSIVVAADPAKDETAVFLAMPSVGAKKALGCLQAVAADNKMTVKQDGELVQISDGHDGVVIALIGDVVVATSSWTDRAKVKAWISGAGAFGKGATGKLAAKVPAGSTAWAATTAAKQLAGTAPGVVQAYGWGTLAGGKLTAEIHADYGNVTTASNNVADANNALAQTAANPPLPSLGPILKTMTIAAAGSELVVKDAVAESDLVALFDAVLAPAH
nr:hypothetical protein [Kofleriaceae bacterium]